MRFFTTISLSLSFMFVLMLGCGGSSNPNGPSPAPTPKPNKITFMRSLSETFAPQQCAGYGLLMVDGPTMEPFGSGTFEATIDWDSSAANPITMYLFADTNDGWSCRGLYQGQSCSNALAENITSERPKKLAYIWPGSDEPRPGVTLILCSLNTVSVKTTGSVIFIHDGS